MPTTRSRAALLDTNASGPEPAADVSAIVPLTSKPRGRKRTRREIENNDLQGETDAVSSTKRAKKRKVSKKKAVSAAPPPPEAMVVPKIIIKRVNKVPPQKALQSLLVGRQRPQAWDIPLEGPPGHAGFSLPAPASVEGTTAHGDSASAQTAAQAHAAPTQTEPLRGEETPVPLPPSGMDATANLDAEAEAVCEEDDDATKNPVAQVQGNDPDGPNFEKELASASDLAATTPDVADDGDAPVAGEEEYTEVPVLENGADEVSGGDKDDENEDQLENREEPLDNCEISEVLEEGAVEDSSGQPPVQGITGLSEDVNDDAFSTHTADAEGESEELFEEIVQVGDQVEVQGEISEVTEEIEEAGTRDDDDDENDKTPSAEIETNLSDISANYEASEPIIEPEGASTAPATLEEEDNFGTYFHFEDGFEFGRESWPVPAYVDSAASTQNVGTMWNGSVLPGDAESTDPLAGDLSGLGGEMQDGEQDLGDGHDFEQGENDGLGEEVENIGAEADAEDMQQSSVVAQAIVLDAFQSAGESGENGFVESFPLDALQQHRLDANSMHRGEPSMRFEGSIPPGPVEISPQLLQDVWDGIRMVPDAALLGFIDNGFVNESLENTVQGNGIQLGDGPAQVNPPFQGTFDLSDAQLAPGMIDRTTSTTSFASSSTLAAGMAPGPSGSAGFSPLVAGMNAVGPSTPTSTTEGIREALCEIAVHVKAISEKLGEIATMM